MDVSNTVLSGKIILVEVTMGVDKLLLEAIGIGKEDKRKY